MPVSGHKGQHWVPRSYLEPWCDPEVPQGHEPFVWMFTKNGSSSKRKAPHNIFKETDLYTVHLQDGTRDLTIEHGLAGLESRFCDIRDDILLKMKTIDEEDHAVLCAFTAAMFLRTPAIRDHWQAQWRKVYEVGEQITRAAEQMSAEEQHQFVPRSLSSSDNNPRLSHEQVKTLMDQPLQRALIPLVPSQTKWLMRMSLAVLVATDDLGFITSDSPCVWFDSEAHKRPGPFNQLGLGYKTVEVTLPVSPTRALLFSWSDHHSGYAEVHYPDGVDEINRRTRGRCTNFFVVRHNKTRPTWFRFARRN